MQEAIHITPADMVLLAAPIDLARIVDIQKPNQRVRYELQEMEQPSLAELLRARFSQ